MVSHTATLACCILKSHGNSEQVKVLLHGLAQYHLALHLVPVKDDDAYKIPRNFLTKHE